MSKEQSILIAPWGGRLVNLLTAPEQLEEAHAHAGTLPSIQLSERAVCDLELLATGGFSPLDGFMGQADYRRVVEEMRLADGTLFPIPVTLPVSEDSELRLDQEIALRDSKNNLLAIMLVEEIYPWDRDADSLQVFGSRDARHPLVAEMHRWGPLNMAGKLQVLQVPPHPDFRFLRRTPAETRALLEEYGHRDVVAFQTRNPLHRAHEELTKRAVEDVDGVLLLHPVVGMTRPGDIDHFTRVRAYRALVDRYYERDRILLSLLPLAMRMAGPREALWHAIIRRNHGANHIIIGRDHAGPGDDSLGRPFYGPYDAQELVQAHAKELGVGVIPFRKLVYLPRERRFEEINRVEDDAEVADISGTQVREDYLGRGRALPTWFTRPEVAEILRDARPPRHRQGACIWLTGLSGSGKSTTADLLTVLLMEHGRQVTVLDGDIVRTHLSKGLGFSQEDRDTNIRRIGFVAAEIVRHGGIVICAAISPWRATRDDVRNMVGTDFIEVYLDTPLEVCEARDSKGLYARARAGEIRGFTGIDDPYEPPLNPEVTLQTVDRDAEDNAAIVLDLLRERGLIMTPQAEPQPA
ncbi:MAG: bifunctional sulfate adenylyltransferase/adenylylsulfate kinase [Anaerolineaceae bacterium]|nr:bifunctional sulfate adenylyltransferase/adenylylsulfate kinase [Anaerolineaceae bacterium]